MRHFIQRNGEMVETTLSNIEEMGNNHNSEYSPFTYYVESDNSGHLYVKHYKCMKHSCNICDGGISWCMTCKEYEGGLTTQCCGRAITEEENELIFNRGELDFRYDRWFEGVNNLETSDETLHKNHRIMIETLKYENAEKELISRIYKEYVTKCKIWGEEPKF